jgi:hypothetical protein
MKDLLQFLATLTRRDVLTIQNEAANLAITFGISLEAGEALILQERFKAWLATPAK